jgi:predicted ATPase
MPPSNVHVLIGKNGVGKTRLLAGMTDALTDNRAATMGLPGEFTFTDVDGEENEFLNLVVVSYSAFDRFNPIFRARRDSKRSIPYYYIGLKKKRSVPGSGDDGAEDLAVLKTSQDFDSEFSRCLETIGANDDERGGHKKKRWLRALDILRSDPGLADSIDQYFRPDTVHQGDQVDQFSILSSGHKIVLLTIAKLVEHVSDRSLVLIDEPETHLHPPLLGSFVRAISELLISQNAVSIIATHSPVVLQEVPAKSVSVITKSGSRIRVRRPQIETFAENVSVLTRKIFGLEVRESGFFRLLKDASEGRDFNEVIAEFGEQIGTEGRALARAFTIEDSDEDE